MNFRLLLRKVTPLLCVILVLISILPISSLAADLSAAPTIELSGDWLRISCDDSSVTLYAIYVGGSLISTVYRTGSTTDYDLSALGLSPGTYQISVAGAVAQTIVTQTSKSVIYTIYHTIEAGQWICKEYLISASIGVPDAWPSDLNSVPIKFSSSGQTYSSMSYSKSQTPLRYFLAYDETPAYIYDQPLKSDFEPYWVSDTYAYIFVLEDCACDEAFYNWFTGSFVYDSKTETVPEVKTTVNIYDQMGINLIWSQTFKGKTAPSITLDVTKNGCTVSYGSDVRSWTTSLSGFTGFCLAGDLACYFVGKSYYFDHDLDGLNHVDQTINLYIATETVSEQYFIIDIYSHDGSDFLDGFELDDPGGKDIKLICTENGLELEVDGDIVYTFEYSSSIAGFTIEPGSGVIYLSEGSPEVLEDCSGSYWIKLYVVPSYGVSLAQFAGFATFLTTVLGGFLSFQIYPGLSFGGMFSMFTVLLIVFFIIKLVS